MPSFLYPLFENTFTVRPQDGSHLVQSYDCSWQFHKELYQLIGKLRKGRAHRRVFRLIEEISGAVEDGDHHRTYNKPRHP
ncbi:uncharacterized protein LY89DRAFT_110675 [Mollisia scopiformis]|uniref:Uncharacterized protein n=1 Tax=Mollisia scopiformis TaxID=149040 RepID=A0A194X596_MOLSC|nr:uncharacterized protein LY89DRAFT_110675 [Mollisia scopiformis]KUJ15358.1 hypothetical protein LY89DRAFT_110675 [Mollisia scopiformis]